MADWLNEWILRYPTQVKEKEIPNGAVDWRKLGFLTFISIWQQLEDSFDF